MVGGLEVCLMEGISLEFTAKPAQIKNAREGVFY